MQQRDEQVGQVQPLDALYWRDEILQVMYWYKGEGFGERVSVSDLHTFLPADEDLLASQMEAMVVDGYLARCDDTPTPRYTFTEYGAREGARRFADEFSDITVQGHGECGPDCPHCKGVARDKCVHCSPAQAAGVKEP
jgi:hypothetical protein